MLLQVIALVTRSVGDLGLLFPPHHRVELSSFIVELADRGAALSGVDYVRALDELAAARTAVVERWGEFDA